MVTNYILSRLSRNERYVKSYWYFPGVYSLRRFTPKHRIPEEYRDSLIIDRAHRLRENSNNPNHINFDEVWDSLKFSKKLTLIPEYQIILDTEFWNECYEGRDIKFRGRQFISLDYYIPEIGLVIELDSNYHHVSEDRSRDLYLKKKYDLEVFRIIGFGSGNKERLREDISNYVNRLIDSHRSARLIDQTDFLKKELEVCYPECFSIIHRCFNIPDNYLRSRRQYVGPNRDVEIINELIIESRLTEDDLVFLRSKHLDPFSNVNSRPTTGEGILRRLLDDIFDPILPEGIEWEKYLTK